MHTTRFNIIVFGIYSFFPFNLTHRKKPKQNPPGYIGTYQCRFSLSCNLYATGGARIAHSPLDFSEVRGLCFSCSLL